MGLATEALRQRGVSEPRQHIMLLRSQQVATLLVSPQPFLSVDVATLEGLARKVRFEIILSPSYVRDAAFERLTSCQQAAGFEAKCPWDISPPTDNRPFFFYMLRPRQLADRNAWQMGGETTNLKAAVVLGLLLITVATLTFLCILLPLFLTSRHELKRAHVPLFLFFSGIGLGFMCIEMSQMQRLIVFLGHPTYGLTVVLLRCCFPAGWGAGLPRESRTETSGERRSCAWGSCWWAWRSSGSSRPMSPSPSREPARRRGLRSRSRCCCPWGCCWECPSRWG